MLDCHTPWAFRATQSPATGADEVDDADVGDDSDVAPYLVTWVVAVVVDACVRAVVPRTPSYGGGTRDVVAAVAFAPPSSARTAVAAVLAR